MTRAGTGWRATLRWHGHQAANGLATVGAVVATELGLRTVGVRRLAGWLGVQLGDAAGFATVDDPPDLPRWALRRLRTVDRVMTWWPFGDTCLRRAFVDALRLRRLRPVLIIGVRLAEDAVEAHAWLRIDGRDLDPEAAAFHELETGSTDDAATG